MTNISEQQYMLFGPLSQTPSTTPSITTTHYQTTNQYAKALNNTSDTNKLPVIPPYLWRNVDLWVWDWDDTLIDTSAYVRHSMSTEYIKQLTDRELDIDFPYWQFFRDLVIYLVENGRRVGIASFGTYTIIRAYMDRIFGEDQKYFIRVNIHASCPDLDCVRDYRQMPLNKNPYIQRLMNHYRITDHGRVILFDDRPSNIADAKRLGVIAVQMGSYNKDTAQWEPRLDGLFGPSTLIQFGDKFADKCLKTSQTGGSHSFGQIGDRKYWRYSQQTDAEDYTRVLNPNFKTSHFENIPVDNHKTHPQTQTHSQTQTHTQLQSLRPQQLHIYTKNINNNNENIKHSPRVALPEKLTNEKNMEHKKSESENNKLKMKNNKFENKNEKIEEGFKSVGSCLSCQSPGSNYLIIGIFLIMLLLIIGFVICG